MEMQKDKLLKNLPLEILGKLRALSAALWAENNTAAIPMDVLIGEFEGELEASQGLLAGLEKHYKELMASAERAHGDETERLEAEIAKLAELSAGFETVSKANAAKVKELKESLDKSEAANREKYSKDEVSLIERQILELKKEVNEFRQLKEMDDHRIMELESMVATKGEEVERRYISKTSLLDKELAELRAANAELEQKKAEDDSKIKELRSALEKSERESREKYSKAEVDLIERQILDLKKELGEFRQLKEIDDRRIMELEAAVATKAEEVERRYIARNTYLEKENAELQAANAGLEKSKLEDDARIKELRGSLEKSERVSREKYTRAEVDMLEAQILELKKEIREGRQLKDLDDRRISELEAQVEAKTDDIEKKYIGRITLLEKKVQELTALSSGLEAGKAQDDSRLAELKKLLAEKDREISERYLAKDVRQLEDLVASQRAELTALKGAKLEDERKIADLERMVGEKHDELEKKHLARIAALEGLAAELRAQLSAQGADNSGLAAQVSEVKKTVIGRDREILELKTRLSDAELEYNEKLAARRKELEDEQHGMFKQAKERARVLEEEFAQKQRSLSARQIALEGDFNANKRELIKTFDKVREELDRREKALEAREAKTVPPTAA